MASSAELKEELAKKKQIYNSIPRLDCLPDKGAKLRQQIESLECRLRGVSLNENCERKKTESVGNTPSVASEGHNNGSAAENKIVHGVSYCLQVKPAKSKTESQTVKLTKNMVDQQVVEAAEAKSLSGAEKNDKEKFDCMNMNNRGETSNVKSDVGLSNSTFLSFADLKTKKPMISGTEPPLISKSPAFSQYRTKPVDRATIKYIDAMPLPQHLMKGCSKFVPAIGSFQQYNPKLLQAKELAVVTIHNSLVTCPSELKEEVDPDGLRTSLMKHQKQALTWLLWRETEEPCGGIFADDMGLGKTLSMIALILKSKEQQLITSSRSDEETQNNPTLIVCLPSIIHQWNNEIYRHCKVNALKVLMYHGPKRETDVKKVCSYDVVLTTYNLILSEGKAMSQKNKPSPIFSVHWNRIILDEAHTIKNHKSQTAVWIFELNSVSRWAVTGTPIHNDLKDVYCLLKFLQCKPFDDYDVWKKLVNDFSEKSECRRNALMKSILLRRSKEEKGEDGELLVPLPSKHFKVHKVEMSEKELDIYNKVFSRLKPKIDDFLAPKANGRHKSAHLLTMLLKLQQCCSHPCLVKSSTEDDKDISSDSVADILNNLSSLHIDGNSSADDSSEFNMSVVEEELDFPKTEKSAKITLLLEKLPKIIVKGRKSVVVSQWVSMLSIVSFHLDKAGISYHIIQGSTKPEERSRISEDFNCNSDGSPVLLLSLKAGGVGLNLVGGSHMFILDLHWNPALEMQACDRICRVGQKHKVYIHKLVCRATIDEKILEMQDQKKRIASVVLQGAKKDVQHLTMNDLKELFNI